MSKVMVEIDCEYLEIIVKEDLLKILDCLQTDLGKIEESKKGHVFYGDWVQDRKEVKKHIKAFKRVLRYYGWEEL